jgi:hypothetical protein
MPYALFHQSPFLHKDCQSGQAAGPPESQGKQSRSEGRFRRASRLLRSHLNRKAQVDALVVTTERDLILCKGASRVGGQVGAT